MDIIPLYVFFIAISLLISVVLLSRNKDIFYLRVFPVFLFISVSVELYAIYLWNFRFNTASIYNFFTLFEFGFYLFVLRGIIRNKFVKKVIVAAALIYIPVAVFNIVFIQGLNTFHTVTYSLGCLLVISFSMFYFFEIFRLPKFIYLTSEPGFWICSGLLFFYCCSFPIFAMSDLIEGAAPFILTNFDKIINVLNVLLYSLFSIAFLCRIRVRKYISS